MSQESGITVIPLNDAEVLEFAEENISGILLSNNQFGSSTVAFVAPGQKQTLHVHTRPHNGVEVIYIYEGVFRLATGDHGERLSRVYDTAVDGPVYLEVASGIPAGIENCGDTRVTFFTVFNPPFEIGEIKYLEEQTD